MGIKYKILCLLLALSFLYISFPAVTAQEMTFYVSTNGSDENSGSISSPFKTLKRASEAVRAINQNMASDIFVYLRGGMYNLEDTIALTEKDGGTNGYYVHYSAYENEKPVISGGVPVGGWKASGEYEGLWETYIGQVPHVSELYVNGRQARRAENERPIRILDPYDDPDTEYPIDGILVSKEEINPSFKNPQDIQVHLPRAWVSQVFRVTEIVENPKNNEQCIVKLENPLASAKRESYHGLTKETERGDFSTPGVWLKNAFAELDTPGEYYYDRHGGKLFYLPREDEDINTAAVYRPVLEKIITIKGADNNNKVKNIVFEGLEITHATWNRGMEEGFSVGQENEIYLTQKYNNSIYNHEKYMIGAAIEVISSDGVIFQNNVIRGMHGAGIALHGGAYNTEIVGNVFEDIGDSAVTVGSSVVPYESKIHDGKNLALHKKVYSSNSENNTSRRYLTDHSEPCAIDPSKLNGWSSNNVSERPWWQIDLEQPYRIHRIEIDSRYGANYDNPLTRRNFEIQGSNDPDFNSYTVLATQGGEPFEHESTAIYRAQSTGEFRYVRVMKTVQEYMYINQIRLINEDMEYCQGVQYPRHNKISNNYVTRAGNVNWGAPGIDVYFTEDVEVSNNELFDLPYSGITTGWGWTNYLDMTESRDIKILNNEIHRFMQYTWDGGGIYNLGPQPDSFISGNYIYDASHYQGGVYLDAGSRYITVSNNVFEDTTSSVLVGSTGQSSNVVQSNYTSSEGCDFEFKGDTVSYAEQPILFAPGDYPLPAIEIIENAGIKREYKHITAKATPRLFEVTAEKRHENPIHTSKVAVGDSVFSRWYLREQVKNVRSWLELVELGSEIGHYSKSEAYSLSEFMLNCEAAYRKNPIDRYEIMELYDELRERVKLFSATRNVPSFRKLLTTSQYIYSISNEQDYTPEEYARFESVLIRAQNIPSSEETWLETIRLLRAYLDFNQNKQGQTIIDSPNTVTKTINVAKNKPVTVSASSYTSYPSESVTDDNFTRDNCWIAYNNAPGAEIYGGRNWAVIDLLRQHQVEKIVIFDRASTNTVTTKGNFRVLGSNDPNFAQYQLLAERGTYTEANHPDFPNNTFVELLISHNEPFRYIKYEKTNITGAQIREIQVFSEVIATEDEIHPQLYRASALGNAVFLEFSEEMDAESVNYADISITEEGTGRQAQITSCESVGHVLRLYIDRLDEVRQYLVSVEGVRNVNGTIMGGRYFHRVLPTNGLTGFRVIDETQAGGRDANRLISGAVLTATATFENFIQAEDIPISLYIGIYSGEKLLELHSVSADIVFAEEKTISVKIQLPNIGRVEDVNIRAFVLERKSLIPFAIKKQIYNF